jgi:NAD(P)-dependent dehydrogenase (short-subunit alcohol dehydrogenase family)
VDLFAGQVAVITGGAGGIGFALAEAAAARGAKIVLADIREAELANAERKLAAAGAAVLPVITDVADCRAWALHGAQSLCFATCLK